MHSSPKYSIASPPGTYETRVFIGGRYVFPWDFFLDIIAKVAIQCDHVPIIARDFGIPRGRERHYCEEIIKVCGKVILELSERGGSYSELEIANKYQPRILCLVWKGQKGLPDISAMVTTFDLFRKNNREYSNLEQLESAVEGFLSGQVILIVQGYHLTFSNPPLVIRCLGRILAHVPIFDHTTTNHRCIETGSKQLLVYHIKIVAPCDHWWQGSDRRMRVAYLCSS